MDDGQMQSPSLTYRVIGVKADGTRCQIMGDVWLHVAEGLAITLRDFLPEADFIVESDQAS